MSLSQLLSQSYVQPNKIWSSSGCEERPYHHLARSDLRRNSQTFEEDAVTSMGNMNQRRQKICSTSKIRIMSDIEDNSHTYRFGLQKSFGLHRGHIPGTTLHGSNGKISSEIHQSNWYIMICYSYDCNHVKEVPMKA
jgi:hypothetical protein